MVVGAFFSAAKDKARCIARNEILTRYIDAPRNNNYTVGMKEVRSLMTGEFPLTPFHWEIEFPEVFDRQNPGFSLIVGNPPYGGKNTLVGGNREGYLDWLKTIHEKSHGNADLVAHFFRRAFNLLGPKGCFGLIATNTIRQGDTRSTGLRWICTHGGTIYKARRRHKWPGQAAVVVSVVHVCRGEILEPFLLDGNEVPIITAYLFHAGGHEDANRLAWNTRHSFKGCDVYGMGFTFDDDPASTAANPMSSLRELLKSNPANREVIFPFIGGEELNGHPAQSFRRYVINFGQRSESDAARWPELFKIVEERVKPERMVLRDTADANRRKAYWWQFSRPRPELQEAKNGLDRIIAISEVTPNCTFAFIPTSWVPAHTLKLFTLESFSAIALVQSRVHEYWARFFGSSLKDDLRYTPSDCFETFPVPEDLKANVELNQAGQEYYEFRADLMLRNSEGLTKTYNRFHDPQEPSADILRLRELHAAMDRAVLEAYDWNDIAEMAYCEFLLDYEDEEDSDDDGRTRRRKKPWRYRWPDEIRDEVLARLLALNAVRAEEEKLTRGAGVAVKKSLTKKSRSRASKKSAEEANSLRF